MKYNILTVWVPVFYANDGISFLNLRFENDVKMYGTQTYPDSCSMIATFENDVKMYGTQTMWRQIRMRVEFENDVKMYGTQTLQGVSRVPEGLRMM